MKNHIYTSVIFLLALSPEVIGSERAGIQAEVKERVAESQKIKEPSKDDERLASALSFLTKVPKRAHEAEMIDPLKGVIKEYLADVYMPRALRLESPIENLSAYDDNGLKIAVSFGREIVPIRIIDIYQNKVLGSLPHAAGQVHAYTDATDHKLLTTSPDLRVWDCQSGNSVELLNGAEIWQNFVAVYTDDTGPKAIINRKQDERIQIWDLRTRACIDTLPFAYSVELSRDAANLGALYEDDHGNKKLLAVRAHLYTLLHAAKFEVDILDLTAKTCHTLLCAENSIDAIETYKDAEGYKAVIALRGGKILIIDLKSNVRVNTVTTGLNRQAVALYKDKNKCKLVVCDAEGKGSNTTRVADLDRVVQIWDLADGHCLHRCKIPIEKRSGISRLKALKTVMHNGTPHIIVGIDDVVRVLSETNSVDWALQELATQAPEKV